jgi:hypothetical protein
VGVWSIFVGVAVSVGKTVLVVSGMIGVGEADVDVGVRTVNVNVGEKAVGVVRVTHTAGPPVTT